MLDLAAIGGPPEPTPAMLLILEVIPDTPEATLFASNDSKDSETVSIPVWSFFTARENRPDAADLLWEGAGRN